MQRRKGESPARQPEATLQALVILAKASDICCPRRLMFVETSAKTGDVSILDGLFASQIAH